MSAAERTHVLYS